MYTAVHSDVAWESNSFDIFDAPSCIPLECIKSRNIYGLCIPVDSFDLRCESVTNIIIQLWLLHVHSMVAIYYQVSLNKYVHMQAFLYHYNDKFIL